MVIAGYGVGAWKDAVTVIVIVLGTAGAAWKWVFAEWLRRRSDLPALDGVIETAIFHGPGPGEAVFLQVTVSWRSGSPFKTYLSPEDTVVRVIDVTAASVTDRLDLAPQELARQGLSIVAEARPLEKVGFFFLEPGTMSPMRSVFRVPRDRILAVEMTVRIDQSRMPRERHRLWWRRQALVSTLRATA